jgi:hypothetical protein
MSDAKVINARCNDLCRCGAHIEIGAVVVDISGVEVRVSVTSDGLKWPLEVKLSPAMAARIDPLIRSEWLRLTGERWATVRAAR